MSRRKSAPAAKPRSAARPAAAGRGIYVQQPRSDVYVAMLGVALGAILVGCVLLLLVWGRYDYSTTVSALFGPVAAPAPAQLAQVVPGEVLRIFG